MTSSQRMSFLREIAAGETIPQDRLAYFRERLRRRIYNYIAQRFTDAESAGQINRADLARRIHRDPGQITRWLNTPGNWTLDTVSDLLLAISAEELELSSTSVLNRPPRNDTRPEWLNNAGALFADNAQKAPIAQPFARTIQGTQTETLTAPPPS